MQLHPRGPRLWGPRGVEPLHHHKWYSLGNSTRPCLRIKKVEGGLAHSGSTLLSTHEAVPQYHKGQTMLATFVLANGKKKYQFPDAYNCFQQTLPTLF